MNPKELLLTYAAIRRFRRQQYLGRDSLRHMQAAKLQRLVSHAYQTTTYYRQLFDEAGVRPGQIRVPEDITLIPISTKADLRAAGSGLISSACRQSDLTLARTSGSTGEPFTLWFDRHFMRARIALFVRALESTGYRLGDRLVLILNTKEKPHTRWPNRRYLYLADAPRRLLKEINRFRPRFICGCLTPLRQIAERIADGEGLALRPQAVISTAETLDSSSRAFLENNFRCRVYDIYGATEVGMVAWECPASGSYHFADDSAIIEKAVSSEGEVAATMTNLELLAMPMIRYNTGDLVTFKEEATCGCGSRLTTIGRFTGRIVDCISLPDGRNLSPYKITLGLEGIGEGYRYQVRQENPDIFHLRIEQPVTNVTEQAFRDRLAEILGDRARITVEKMDSLDPPPGKKFRVVEGIHSGEEKKANA